MRVIKIFTKTVASLVSLMLDLIGAGGIPDDLVQWQQWIAKYEPYIENIWGRFFLIVLGTGIILWLWRPKPPHKTRPEPHNDWSIRTALDWIVFESRWGWGNLAKFYWFYPLGACGELRSRAYSGEVVIEGRKRGDFEFKPVPRDYWNIMQFRAEDYLDSRDIRSDMPKIGVEFRQITPVSVPKFDEYRVSADQIVQVWPKAAWWFRWLMRIEWAGRYLLAWGKTVRRWAKHYVSR